jgi:hypothetical protein
MRVAADAIAIERIAGAMKAARPRPAIVR